MRPERRFSGRNGKGRLGMGRPKLQPQTSSDISLLRAKNGLDNGGHFTWQAKQFAVELLYAWK
jgi:hypothetical protein